MHAYDPVGVRSGHGDLTNRDRTRVRREDGARRDRLHFAQHGMLDRQVFEHRFDHQVGIRKSAVVDRATN